MNTLNPKPVRKASPPGCPPRRVAQFHLHVWHLSLLLHSSNLHRPCPELSQRTCTKAHRHVHSCPMSWQITESAKNHAETKESAAALKILLTKKVVDTHQGSQVYLHSLCLCMLSELALGEVEAARDRSRLPEVSMSLWIRRCSHTYIRDIYTAPATSSHAHSSFTWTQHGMIQKVGNAL